MWRDSDGLSEYGYSSPSAIRAEPGSESRCGASAMAQLGDFARAKDRRPGNSFHRLCPVDGSRGGVLENVSL
jgi:hypothetical protein